MDHTPGATPRSGARDLRHTRQRSAHPARPRALPAPADDPVAHNPQGLPVETCREDRRPLLGAHVAIDISDSTCKVQQKAQRKLDHVRSGQHERRDGQRDTAVPCSHAIYMVPGVACQTDHAEVRGCREEVLGYTGSFPPQDHAVGRAESLAEGVVGWLVAIDHNLGALAQPGGVGRRDGKAGSVIQDDDPRRSHP